MTDTTQIEAAVVAERLADFRASPAEADAALARMTAEFRGPPPTATPTTPAEASARLQQLMADPAWREGYLTGVTEQRQEFTRLTELAASGDQPLNFPIEVIDGVSDPHAVSRANYAGMFDVLREQGLPASAEQYMRDLDAGRRTDRPTAGDGTACRAALDRLTRNSEWVSKWNAGDIGARNLHATLNRVIAYAADDGMPVTEAVERELALLGLR
jgi:hypothetical protein